ncbi:MAG: ferritin-like protein [Gemmataceae bacterium]|nr:ferritin-like protein [Gemmataceae bacterium]
MAAKSMHDLFADQIQDAYSAETQLTKALPKMAKAATNPELRAGFEQHLTETEGQVRRLEQIGKELNIKVTSKKCEAMEGLISEAKDIMGLGLESDVQDAGLIAAAQKVEHYEIALYGCLCTWAKRLGYTNAQTLLHQTLEEEKRTDEKLTRLAEAQVNMQAAAR